jgi:hypothetical protein
MMYVNYVICLVVLRLETIDNSEIIELLSGVWSRNNSGKKGAILRHVD